MNRRRAFTLIEVIVAVVLIGLIAVTLQRFVTTMLIGIGVSSEREAESERAAGLFRYIDAQLDDLTPRAQSSLLGTPHKFGNNLPSDELQWRCLPGAGTLSSTGTGEWFVTLTVMPQSKTSAKLDLGLKRRYVDADETSYDWVPLMKDVAGVKFEFYSQQFNAWLERWNETASRPRLVRMRLWRTKDSLPETAVFTVNSARIER
ncbi:MAG: prepilin-type N-terminal cleavage/methylation domain-containing protein [Chthoniobacteraceae bacterium]